MRGVHLPLVVALEAPSHTSLQGRMCFPLDVCAAHIHPPSHSGSDVDTMGLASGQQVGVRVRVTELVEPVLGL